jgi:hypothetical protein
MVRGALLRRLAAALAATVSLAHAQPQAPTTEAQARYYVYGAFLTHAVPEIIADRVALGPELERQLGVASGADRQRIYDALMAFTDKRPLSVRKATVDEIKRYAARGGRDLKDPMFTVQAGDVRLLVQYDLRANTIPFVGQLDVALQAPVVERSAPVKPAVAPPLATIAPKPSPAPARVAPLAPLKADGPCVVKPVMSEQDLANCRAARPAAARVQPAPPPPEVAPVVTKPQARAAPPAVPARRPAGPCEIKPVMSEEDLANCRAATPAPSAAPPALPAVKPQARVAPPPAQRPMAPCEIKPVMSEEDLANCRSATAAPSAPPPASPAMKPQARIEPPPARPVAPCEIKPVMSEEDLANCRAAAPAPGSAPPAPAVIRPAQAAPAAERRVVPACIVKPVMTAEELAACGARPQ